MTTLALLHPKSDASLREIVIVSVNERWRVIDNPQQWILQFRKGRATAKASGWRDRRFHVQRTALIRSIAELCGPVAADARATLEALPGAHPSPAKPRRDD